MAQIKFNLNEYIELTLTDIGLKYWRQSGWGKEKRIRVPAWVFIQAMGRYFGNGAPDVIENNEIIIWKEPKKDALNRTIDQWNIYQNGRETWHFNSEEKAKEYIEYHAECCSKYGHRITYKKCEAS